MEHGEGPAPKERPQLGGGGVLVWAAVIVDELDRPSWVKDGLKINNKTSCSFLEDTLTEPCCRK